MKELLMIVFCLLLFFTTPFCATLHAKDNGEQDSKFPRSFLQKNEGSVTVTKESGSISVWANRATPEEILEKVALGKKVRLQVYCQDPIVKQERIGSIRSVADSVEGIVRQVLPGDYEFKWLNGEKAEKGNRSETATLNIVPKGCAGTDPPVRVFFEGKEHPVMKKPVEAITLGELSEVLKRGGPGARRRAADVLGLKDDERGIALAKEALKDENPGVMFSAAGALKRLGQRFGFDKVGDAVYARFREKPYADLLPIMAAVDTNRIWEVIDGIVWDQSGEREKGIIVRSLNATNDSRAIRYLVKLSAMGNLENANQAVFGMGKIGGPEAEEALMRLLNEGDPLVQARAAQAVSFLPKGAGVRVRAELDRMVKEEGVADALLFALAEVSYLDPLEKVIRDPASKVKLKIRALMALAKRETTRTIEIMVFGLDDKEAEVRAASIQAMVALGVEGAIPYLIKAAVDKDEKVRKSAVRGLSDFPKDDDVIEALGKAVNDVDGNVRRAAVNSLQVIGMPTEKMVAILLSCKSHTDPYVVDKAVAILNQWHLQ
jgi:HEAT repeat protein